MATSQTVDINTSTPSINATVLNNDTANGKQNGAIDPTESNHVMENESGFDFPVKDEPEDYEEYNSDGEYVDTNIEYTAVKYEDNDVGGEQYATELDEANDNVEYTQIKGEPLSSSPEATDSNSLEKPPNSTNDILVPVQNDNTNRTYGTDNYLDEKFTKAPLVKHRDNNRKVVATFAPNLESSNFYACKKCFYFTDQTKHVYRHVKVHDSGAVINVLCGTCKEMYPEDQMRFHIIKKHFGVSPNILLGINTNIFQVESDVATLLDNNPYVCKLCSYKTNLKRLMYLHLGTKHYKAELYECTYCHFNSVEKEQVYIHYLQNHPKCKSGGIDSVVVTQKNSWERFLKVIDNLYFCHITPTELQNLQNRISSPNRVHKRTTKGQKLIFHEKIQMANEQLPWQFNEHKFHQTPDNQIVGTKCHSLQTDTPGSLKNIMNPSSSLKSGSPNPGAGSTNLGTGSTNLGAGSTSLGTVSNDLVTGSTILTTSKSLQCGSTTLLEGSDKPPSCSRASPKNVEEPISGENLINFLGTHGNVVNSLLSAKSEEEQKDALALLKPRTKSQSGSGKRKKRKPDLRPDNLEATNPKPSYPNKPTGLIGTPQVAWPVRAEPGGGPNIRFKLPIPKNPKEGFRTAWEPVVEPEETGWTLEDEQQYQRQKLQSILQTNNEPQRIEEGEVEIKQEPDDGDDKREVMHLVDPMEINDEETGDLTETDDSYEEADDDDGQSEPADRTKRRRTNKQDASLKKRRQYEEDDEDWVPPKPSPKRKRLNISRKDQTQSVQDSDSTETNTNTVAVPPAPVEQELFPLEEIDKPNKEIYICKSCVYVSTTIRAVKVHSKRFHCEYKPYKCRWCSAGFVERMDVVNHQQVEHNIKSALDKQDWIWNSQEGFESELLMQNSFRTLMVNDKQVKEVFKCSKCVFVTTFREIIERHVSMMHAEVQEDCYTITKEEEFNSGDNITVNFQCQACSTRAMNFLGLRYHILYCTKVIMNWFEKTKLETTNSNHYDVCVKDLLRLPRYCIIYSHENLYKVVPESISVSRLRITGVVGVNTEANDANDAPNEAAQPMEVTRKTRKDKKALLHQYLNNLKKTTVPEIVVEKPSESPPIAINPNSNEPFITITQFQQMKKGTMKTKPEEHVDDQSTRTVGLDLSHNNNTGSSSPSDSEDKKEGSKRRQTAPRKLDKIINKLISSASPSSSPQPLSEYSNPVLSPSNDVTQRSRSLSPHRVTTSPHRVPTYPNSHFGGTYQYIPTSGRSPVETPAPNSYNQSEERNIHSTAIHAGLDLSKVKQEPEDQTQSDVNALRSLYKTTTHLLIAPVSPSISNPGPPQPVQMLPSPVPQGLIQQTHQPEDNAFSYLCLRCPYATLSIQTMEQHVLIHCICAPYMCQKCDFRATSNKDMNTHLQRSVRNCVTWHFDREVAKTQLEEIRTLFNGYKDKDITHKCNMCKYSTEHGAMIRAHVIQQHSTRNFFKCGHCGFEDSKRHEILLHSLTEHAEKEVSIIDGEESKKSIDLEAESQKYYTSIRQSVLNK
ncbi:unnamed protein product [Owenia fusiformis]|uniref:Uncharacterized protein n=1 Tax=Owenia fusiformis TaxID=6347 RepID=A0A8J1XPP6_OWEFU|nr:unnamed protein product [Owenia fusiformis]